MTFNKFLLIALTPALWFSSQAQEVSQEQSSPKKFTFAPTVSYNSYAGVANVAPQGNLSGYELQATSVNWHDKQLMVGFEAGMFVSEANKLSTTMGLSYQYHPGYTEKPAVGTVIPAYRAVANEQLFTFALGLGYDRYFGVSTSENLKWFAGCRLGWAYSSNVKKYDEVQSFGNSVSEAMNFKLGAVVGADYYFSESFFVGAQIDVLSYTYGFVGVKPQPGLAKLAADNHNFGVLSAPTIKIGFVF